MAIPNQKRLLEYVLKGNKEAISFCETLWGISQIWDDLYDGDKPVSKSDINAMMWDALVTLPNNLFYQAHYNELTPVLRSAFFDWMDSNELQNGPVRHKAAAYVLRDSVSCVLIHCAWIIGGYAWVREVSPKIREALYNESVIGFIEEHS